MSLWGTSDEPGTARLVSRRLKAAAGVAGLPPLETRVEELAGEIAESRALDVPLEAAIARLEAALVRVLEARGARDPGHGPQM